MLLDLVLCAALAGDLVVDASVPLELRDGNRLVARTWAPTTFRLPRLDAGPHLLSITAGGSDRSLTAQVPDAGGIKVIVGKAAPVTEDLPAVEAPSTTLELRAASGQQFALILDGKRTVVFTDVYPLRLEGLAAGDHHVELRSDDLLTIWAHGTLTLPDKGRVVLNADRGAPLDVLGPDGAWSPEAAPAGGARAPE